MIDLVTSGLGAFLCSAGDDDDEIAAVMMSHVVISVFSTCLVFTTGEKLRFEW